ncbi:MAG TPA: hypothetical protein VGE98_06700, partial [Thermoanaerobaculia bacterium]
SAGDFKEYRLYADPGDGSAAVLLRRSGVPVQADVLGAWSTLGLPEGAVYTLRLEAEDVSGNVARAQAAVTVDNRPPAAPAGLTATADGADAHLAWQPNGEPDLAGYLLYRNGRLVNAQSAVSGDLLPFALSGTAYDDRALPDGRLTYELYAIDQAGNLSAPSAPAELALDTHPPHAVLAQPAAGTRFESSIYLLATTADTDLARVQMQWRAAGGAWNDVGAPLLAAPWEATWTPGALPRGDYELRAVATDLGGKTAPAPAAVTVTYADLTPPPAVATLAASGHGGDVTLTWSAVSASDLAGYLVDRVDLAQPDAPEVRLNASPLAATSTVDAGLPDGRYAYTVRAVDASGNSSLPSPAASATVFTPHLAQPYTPTAATASELAGEAVEAVGETVALAIDPPTGPAPTPAVADASGAFAFHAIPLARGDNRLSVTASDGDGNVSKPAAVVVLSAAPPATPSGLSATAGATGVDLAWSANPEPAADLLGYRLLRDGAPLPAPAAIPSLTATASSQLDAPPAVAVDGDSSTFWLPADAAAGSDSTDADPWLAVSWSERRLVARVEIDGRVDGADFDLEGWDGRA